MYVKATFWDFHIFDNPLMMPQALTPNFKTCKIFSRIISLSLENLWLLLSDNVSNRVCALSRNKKYNQKLCNG